MPPLTEITCPVTYEASSPASHTTAFAMSSAVQDFVTPFLTVVLISAVISSDLTQSNLLTGTLLAGLLGLVTPGTAAFFHNASTIGLALYNMTNLVPEME